MERSELALLYKVMVKHYHRAFRHTRTRRRDVVEKKQMFAMVARHYGAKYEDIADFLGWNAHTTAMWAVRQMKGLMEFYPAMRRQFERILEKAGAALNRDELPDVTQKL